MNRKMKGMIGFIFGAFLVGTFYVLIEFDPMDIMYRLRDKTFMEENFRGCILGVSNEKNTVQNLFPVSNVFYLFEDSFPVDILEHAVTDSISMITWEPFDKSERNRSLLPDIVAGRYDEHVKEFAAQAKAFAKPLIIRFAHEMNGNWYPWSGTSNGIGPHDFIDSFRRIRLIFRANGASNVVFAFSVNNEDVPNEKWNRFENYYPGGDVVDLVMIDAYNSAKRIVSPKRLLMKSYERIIKSFPDKPIMIGEVGTTSLHVDKAEWIEDFFDTVKRRFPAIKGIIWFDMIKEEDWGFSHDPDLARIVLAEKSDTYYNLKSDNLTWMFTNEKK